MIKIEKNTYYKHVNYINNTTIECYSVRSVCVSVRACMCECECALV